MFSYDYIYLSSRHRRPEEGRSAPRSHPQDPPAAPAASRPGHPPTGRGRATAPALAGRGLPPPADSSPAPLRRRRLDPPRHRPRPRRRPGHPRLAPAPPDQPAGRLPGHPATPARSRGSTRGARRVDGRLRAGAAGLPTPTDLRPTLPTRPTRRPPAPPAAGPAGLPRLPHHPGHPMSGFIESRSGRCAPARPTPHRASWTEYQRLLTAGVNPTTAAILATGHPPPDDERAYWRQLAHHTPTTPATRAAHATAQRQRRSASAPSRWSLR